MSFDPLKIDLPIRELIPELISRIETEPSLIVHAPPGAGKSTLLPLALLDQPFLAGKKILMLEPRRLAAKSIAMRMSELLGTKLGDRIGYRVRFESAVSDHTAIEVLTEGILTRMLQKDQELSDIGLVIFDEFHERSIHADLALALCREAQKVLRPDLKILIMSATLNTERLKDMMDAPVLHSAGRQYPVDVIHGDGTDMRLSAELVSRKVQEAFKQDEGDILAFLPGEAEIKRAAGELKARLTGAEIHPLFGMLPPQKQMAAILPSRQGKRKVVLATSIAQTSLTIEGIKVVVDSGLIRKSRFDPRSGLSRLETQMVSMDAADQRAGRAGRLSAGKCYRLWSLADQNRLHRHDVPEILEADLCALALELANWGIHRAEDLDWVDVPPEGHFAKARQTLEDLGAIEDKRITDHGKQLLELPCHPRLAHMLLLAAGDHSRQLACDLAALLEERDPLPKGSGIDINLRVEALRRYRASGNGTGRIARIAKIAESYLRLFRLSPDNGAFDPYESGLLLAHAFPERIASSRPGNNSQFQMANGRIAQAGPKDELGHEAWLAVAAVDAREGLGKIFLAAPLNPRDLAPLVKQVSGIRWDAREEEIVANTELRIGSILLQSKPLPEIPEIALQKAQQEALQQEGLELLDWNEAVINWQNRVMSVRQWEGDAWPDVSNEALLKALDSWLLPYLGKTRKKEEFRKVKVLELLPSVLSWEQQQELEQRAPDRIEVPSGSMIPLNYKPNGDAPVLSVRLQQVFGLADTPQVNKGKIPVLMELLSPASRPVQTTQDLKSFWNDTYFEVRKELKRRYPKHYWPDDPWNAEAIKGVRPKK